MSKGKGDLYRCHTSKDDRGAICFVCAPKGIPSLSRGSTGDEEAEGQMLGAALALAGEDDLHTCAPRRQYPYTHKITNQPGKICMT